jgi:hypothetical protein
MNRYKNFSIKFILLLFGLIILNTMISHILGRVYEHNFLTDILKKQHTDDAIYGSLLNNNEFELSLSRIEYIQPDIITLGSSRVLPFREEFFSTKFAGAGRAVTQITEAGMFIDRIVEMEHVPKTIMFGLDFWWFHNDYAKRNVSSRHLPTEKGFASNKLRSILDNIVRNRIDISDVAKKILFDAERKQYRQYTDFHSMGLNALNNFSGFRKDGSYFYGNILAGYRPSADKQFKNTVMRINNGTDKFRYGDHVNEQAWESLLYFVKKAQDNNIEVILFYPPLSNKVFELMDKKSTDYKYIDILTKRLEQLGNFFDFHNPSILNTNSCEFIDGFHGGETTNARLLQYINEKMTLPLSDVIDTYILMGASKTLIKLNKIERSNDFREVDFLQLGCNKHISEISFNE